MRIGVNDSAAVQLKLGQRCYRLQMSVDMDTAEERSRHGFADKVTLRFLAATLIEEIELGLCFHTFCQNPHVERSSH